MSYDNEFYRLIIRCTFLCFKSASYQHHWIISVLKDRGKHLHVHFFHIIQHCFHFNNDPSPGRVANVLLFNCKSDPSLL